MYLIYYSRLFFLILETTMLFFFPERSLQISELFLYVGRIQALSSYLLQEEKCFNSFIMDSSQIVAL